jgi:antitoxin PrlF
MKTETTAILEETSTITAKGQTTIPRSVRQALGLRYGDKIAFRVDERGVTVHRSDAEDDDPAIASFLAFLARDIEGRPEAIQALTPTLAARIAALTVAMDVDPNDEIEGEVSL